MRLQKSKLLGKKILNTYTIKTNLVFKKQIFGIIKSESKFKIEINKIRMSIFKGMEFTNGIISFKFYVNC